MNQHESFTSRGAAEIRSYKPESDLHDVCVAVSAKQIVASLNWSTISPSCLNHPTLAQMEREAKRKAAGAAAADNEIRPSKRQKLPVSVDLCASCNGCRRCVEHDEMIGVGMRRDAPCRRARRPRFDERAASSPPRPLSTTSAPPRTHRRLPFSHPMRENIAVPSLDMTDAMHFDSAGRRRPSRGNG